MQASFTQLVVLGLSLALIPVRSNSETNVSLENDILSFTSNILETDTVTRVERSSNLYHWEAVGSLQRGYGQNRYHFSTVQPSNGQSTFYRFVTTPIWAPDEVDLEFIKNFGGYTGDDDDELELLVINGSTYIDTHGKETRDGQLLDATLRMRVEWHQDSNDPNIGYLNLFIISMTIRSPAAAAGYFTVDDIQRRTPFPIEERFEIQLTFTGYEQGSYFSQVHLTDGTTSQHEYGSIESLLNL